MLKMFFAHRPFKAAQPKTVVVVSGLPRSGTSMMMKMLAEGGLEVISDAVRRADDDNPNGYFELEQVKQLTEGNTRWLGEAGGRVVKVISSLLEYLPAAYEYKVVFLERDLQEILASQQKMLKNRQEALLVDDVEMRTQFEQHLTTIKYWLARQPNMTVMYVNYNRMLAEPQIYCKRIAEFIGMPLNVDKMLSIPSPSLYRNRARNS